MTETRLKAVSKLHEGPVYTDPKVTQYENSCFWGSRDLCRAILKTGKMHRKMTEAEQVEAVSYAYNVDITMKGKRK